MVEKESARSWAGSRRWAQEGKIVKVKRVHINKGERLGELFAGTPSLTIVKLFWSVAAEKDLAIILLDVKCAFLQAAMRRNVYIKLPRQDPTYGDGHLMGKLKKALRGTRDAPQFWGDCQGDGVHCERVAPVRLLE